MSGCGGGHGGGVAATGSTSTESPAGQTPLVDTSGSGGRVRTTPTTVGDTAGSGGSGTGSGGSGTATTTTGSTTASNVVSSADFTGSGQSGVVGTTASAPFIVTLLDVNGDPVAGVTVTFTITSGGGTLSTTTAVTDANGQAQTTLTYGTAAGVTTITATADGLADPITFTATALAGPPATIGGTSGDGQTGSVGSTLAPFVVTVQDAYGNPVPGTTVTFTITSGVGSISTATAATDANGQAQTTLTLGSTPGATTVVATAGALPDSPITFTATAVTPSGVPSAIAASSTTLGSATVGTTFPSPFSVLVTDSAGQPVSGVTVTFTITAGDGSISNVTAMTDANGIASTTLTLGKTAGANTVSASANGPDGQPLAGGPVIFTVTGVAGAPVGIAFTVQPTRTVQTLAITPAVKVAIVDGYGNAVATSSDTISMAIGTNPSGGTLLGTKQVATTNGVAVFANLAIDLPGAGYTLVATSDHSGTATSRGFEIAAPPVLLSVGSLATARTDLGAVLGADGLIYAMGGRGADGTILSSVERYDASTNVWSAGPAMRIARTGFAAVSLPDGRILVIGGYDAQGQLLASIDAFNPATGAWSGPIANLPTAVGGCAAAVGADGRVYVFGGRDGSGGTTSLVQIYNPSTGAWARGYKLPHSSAGITATAASDGRIYVMGGDVAGSIGPTIWAYDAKLDEWDHAATQPKAEPGIAAATGSDGKVYALGSYDNATEVFQSYKANANQSPYETVVGLSTFRSGLAAVTGPDGRIYAIGGVEDGVVLDLVEAYGPAVSVSTNSGPAGTVVSVNGGNFAPDATVAVYWGSIGPTTLLGTGQSDSGGRLTAPILVTIPSTPGSRLVVVDTKSQYPVSVPFTVQ